MKKADDSQPLARTMTTLLRKTALLDHDHPAIRSRIDARGWRDLPPFERIGAAYTFVRDGIAFGYDRDDAIRVGRVPTIPATDAGTQTGGSAFSPEFATAEPAGER